VDWVQWGDAPSWFAAVGTIAAVGVALGLAVREGRRRSAQDRRRQAELITAWVRIVEAPLVRVMVANASHEVAYRLVVSIWTLPAGAHPVRPDYDPIAWRYFVSQLPPGEKPVDVEWPVAAGLNERPGVEIVFQDAAGRHWIRDTNGTLVEIKETDHLAKLGLSEPLPWDREV
jgi:hypothetical protein